MKFLILAFGDEKDWNELSKQEQDSLLAQDEVLRKRGDRVAAVENHPTTVTAWDGKPTLRKGAYAASKAPLASFGVVEAADLDGAVQLVANTPCARAKGAVEIRAIIAMNEPRS